MSTALENSYRGGVAVEFWAVEFAVDGGFARITAGGTVTLGGETYTARHPIYGTISSIGVITDGIGTEAQTQEIDLLPPTTTGMAALASPLQQGAPFRLFSGTVDRQTGEVIDYEQHFIGGVHYSPVSVNGTGWVMSMECGTDEILQKADDDDKTLSSSHHKSVWGSGETGLDNVTLVRRKVFWRANGPSGSLNYGGGAGGGGSGGGAGGDFVVPNLK